MSAGYRNCPNCGRLIASDATVCRHCGANLGGNENSSRAEAREPQGDRANGRFNFPEVLTFMFQDRNIAQKLGGFSLLVFLSFMLQYSAALGANKDAVVEMGVNLPYIVTNAILGLIILGYNFSLIESLSSQSGNYKIPAINFGRNIGKGFTWVIAGLIFGFGVALIVVLGLFMLRLGPAVTGIGFFLAFILMLFCLFFMPAYMWIFANHTYFTIFFRFSLAIRCIAYDFVRYIIALAVFLVYIIFVVIFYTFFMMFTKSISLIAFSAIAAVLYAYGTMVSSYITAKALSSNCRQELY